MVTEAFAAEIAAGIDIRPTIAVTKAQVILPEIGDALGKGRLTPDGRVLLATGAAQVTKAAVEPVWHLPGWPHASAAARTICAVCFSKRPAACIPSW